MYFRHGGSHIDSWDWIKTKKATIDSKNKDNIYFQHVVTVELNFTEVESHSEKVSNIKRFANKFNWKGINFLSKTDGWKMFEKSNPTIALNMLYIKEKEICYVYICKIISNCEKLIIILMIPNLEKEAWYYPAVEEVCALLREITSK